MVMGWECCYVLFLSKESAVSFAEVDVGKCLLPNILVNWEAFQLKYVMLWICKNWQWVVDILLKFDHPVWSKEDLFTYESVDIIISYSKWICKYFEASFQQTHK